MRQIVIQVQVIQMQVQYASIWGTHPSTMTLKVVE